ncbi:ATP-binding cassette domain-containing protein, partial [Pseudomonas mediterranea]
MKAAPLLSVENLTVRFPGATNWYGRVTSQVHAVNNVDLCVLPGESLGIVGESGCGKSTLVQAVIGLVGLTSGRVLVDGHDFAGANGTLKRDLRQKMQIVFQDPQ